MLCLAPQVPVLMQAQEVCGTAAGAHLRQTHHPEKPFSENDLPLGFVGASSTAFSPPAHTACWVQQLSAVEEAAGTACICAAPTIEPCGAQGRNATGQQFRMDRAAKKLLGSAADQRFQAAFPQQGPLLP